MLVCRGEERASEQFADKLAVVHPRCRRASDPHAPCSCVEARSERASDLRHRVRGCAPHGVHGVTVKERTGLRSAGRRWMDGSRTSHCRRPRRTARCGDRLGWPAAGRQQHNTDTTPTPPRPPPATSFPVASPHKQPGREGRGKGERGFHLDLRLSRCRSVRVQGVVVGAQRPKLR